jgi:hypothetical protein
VEETDSESVEELVEEGHRKPLPQEAIDKRMGEPRGKQMGQKNTKRAAAGDARAFFPCTLVKPPSFR